MLNLFGLKGKISNGGKSEHVYGLNQFSTVLLNIAQINTLVNFIPFSNNFLFRFQLNLFDIKKTENSIKSTTEFEGEFLY